MLKTHPERTDLTASHFFPPDGDILSPEHPMLAQWRLFESTVNWLEEEGYVRFESGPGLQAYDPSFSLVGLSEKGFRTMVRPLSSLSATEDKEPIGTKLLAAARSAATKGAGALTLDAGKMELAHIIQQLFS